MLLPCLSALHALRLALLSLASFRSGELHSLIFALLSLASFRSGELHSLSLAVVLE
jgi:hypothetical protein